LNGNKAQTRRTLIDPLLMAAGWDIYDRMQVGNEIPADGYSCQTLDRQCRPWNQLAGIRILVPPVALQDRFARFAARHKRLRSVQRESLCQADHIFQTLHHQAFTGKNLTN